MNPSINETIARFMHEAPVDLEGMARELGISVSYDSSLPPSISGMLKRDRGGTFGYRIVVNSRDNRPRQRFTIAHELAHYVLHRDLISEDLVDNALYRSAQLNDDMEREADRFAAQLLLPAALVREAYSRQKALGPLAHSFGVSDAALRIRLRELHLAA